MGLNKNFRAGYIKALRDTLDQECTVLLVEGTGDQKSEHEILVVESKLIRERIEAMMRDKEKDN